MQVILCLHLYCLSRSAFVSFSFALCNSRMQYSCLVAVKIIPDSPIYIWDKHLTAASEKEQLTVQGGGGDSSWQEQWEQMQLFFAFVRSPFCRQSVIWSLTIHSMCNIHLDVTMVFSFQYHQLILRMRYIHRQSRPRGVLQRGVRRVGKRCHGAQLHLGQEITRNPFVSSFRCCHNVHNLRNEANEPNNLNIKPHYLIPAVFT